MVQADKQFAGFGKGDASTEHGQEQIRAYTFLFCCMIEGTGGEFPPVPVSSIKNCIGAGSCLEGTIQILSTILCTDKSQALDLLLTVVLAGVRRAVTST